MNSKHPPFDESQLNLIKKRRYQQAFTLVELLVVIAVIGLLIALLLPAVQAAREAARRMSCQNNIKQVALAFHNFESSHRAFPPSVVFFGSGDPRNREWSPHARILPFLEETQLEAEINYTMSYEDVFWGDVRLSASRIASFLCPTEMRDEVRLADDGAAIHYPVNYGVNHGVWFVYDPRQDRGGSGAFFPNSRLGFRSFSDGSSNTLLMAEVKAYNPYLRDGGADPPEPATHSDEICSLAGSFKQNSGHTEWVDGKVHQTGFTAAFAPNTEVICQNDSTEYDVDWTSQREGRSDSGRTFAAVTSRSYHAGGVVNVAMVDGSTHAIDDAIDLTVWRAMATRNGGETVQQRAD